MTTFIQLHALTSYPPSNLNRDDLGRPKTAVMGGTQRLRVSSQSLKRAWRTSELFESALAGHIGTRTKRMGVQLFEKMQELNMKDADALKAARSIAEQFGKPQKPKKDKPEQGLLIEQIAHFSPEEIKGAMDLAEVLATEKRQPTKDELALLRRDVRAADIALFGRMLASSPRFNVDAAAQVAHAITVHPVAVEDDYFTAVDDLNRGEEDAGAGHVGESEFGAGVFYLYVCINRSLLMETLKEEALVNKAVKALVECALTISPKGKQNSFASRAYASYALVEVGQQQPRSLSSAFIKPVGGMDLMAGAVKALEETRGNMARIYKQEFSAEARFNVLCGEGSMQSVLEAAVTSAEG
jgi:CRISPR system Cascade subunit CasC